MSMWGSGGFCPLVFLMSATGGAWGGAFTGVSCHQAGSPCRTGMQQQQTQSCCTGTGVLQPLWRHFCKTAPCSGHRWWEAGRHPLQLLLHPFSLPQHSQTLPHPHGLLQEILLFPGMFLSKIALIGLRKKNKLDTKITAPGHAGGLGSKATLSR